jgi:hypothetical protein
MSFWSSPSLDPKRQFRFKVKFKGAGAEAPVYLAQSAERPIYTVSGNTKIDFLDKSFNYPGKVTWNDIKIKFIDGVDKNENMASQAYKYLTAAGFILPNNVNAAAGTGFSTISKNGAIITTVKVEPLKTDGTTAETYTLNNAFITTAGLTGFDYGQEGFATAEFTLKYDWASYE